MLVIKTFEVFNLLKNQTEKIPFVNFVELQKTIEFETSSLEKTKDTKNFIYNIKISYLESSVNKEMALNHQAYFKRLQN